MQLFIDYGDTYAGKEVERNMPAAVPIARALIEGTTVWIIVYLVPFWAPSTSPG